jgi:L-asparaginase/beta-aspartyl-peptidase (threonine type)
MFLFFYVSHNAISAALRRSGAAAAQGLRGENNSMSNTQDYAIVVHGGAGSPRAHDDGCRLAARRAVEELSLGADALEAAVGAVVAMEADGRFNAGSGAVLCMDGATVEMDASIMDTRGRLGAVAIVHPNHTGISAHQRAAHEKVVRELTGCVPALPGIAPEAKAFVRGPDGHFAVALSTGTKVPVGRIAVSRTQTHAHSNQDMPHARIVAS